MKDWQSQSHVKWECKYHVVIVPNCREKKHFKNIAKRSARLSESYAVRKEFRRDIDKDYKQYDMEGYQIMVGAAFRYK